mmetsp:Transcript_23975/g.66433  ORF Transcript_23975/g.66433 Transcript_23975/m.66433 type:complete len:123 (-) Transcript_23975:1589-1957(-)
MEKACTKKQSRVVCRYQGCHRDRGDCFFPRGNICDVGDFRDTHILESIERSHNALRQLASFHHLVTTRRDHLFEVYHLSPGGAFSFLSSILILISHYYYSATPIAVDDLSLIRIFSLIDTTL